MAQLRNNRTGRRLLAAAGAVTIGALALAGCSGGGGSTEESGDVLKLWHYEGADSAMGKAWAEAIKVFEEETGATVEFEEKSFEQIQKNYPELRHFYCRDKGDFVLEEEKDRGHYRWCSVEPRRLCSGQVNPDDIEGALEEAIAIARAAGLPLVISHHQVSGDAMKRIRLTSKRQRGFGRLVLSKRRSLPLASRQPSTMLPA